jgi:hypothetical protein
LRFAVPSGGRASIRRGRPRRSAALDAGRAEAARRDEADAPLTTLLEAADLLARAALVGAGFHEHRGEWRRRNNVTDD